LYGDIIDYQHEKNGIDYIAFTNSDYLKSDFGILEKLIYGETAVGQLENVKLPQKNYYQNMMLGYGWIMKFIFNMTLIVYLNPI